jgi:hypothetical protein
MPAEVPDRIHGFARRARAHRGLTFTNSDGNNLDTLYPPDDDDADSDYNPDEDDSASYASSEDSDFDADAASTSSSNDSDNESDGPPVPDLAEPQPGELAGVDNTNAPGNTTRVSETPGVDNGNNIETTGVVGEEDGSIETTGVDDEEPPGVDNTDLETCVDELEAELDQEIADLDSDYEESTDPDSNHEQTEDDDDTSTNENDASTPLPRLRWNRSPNYGHLKGRDGDGSLPTVAGPEEFKGGRHQAYIILQSIVMTQCNLKQGIKEFGDQGKAAVLVELQQLYDGDVMRPVNKYDLTPTEQKGVLRYLSMILKEKRCGTIKGRGCADGQPQRYYMSKQETSSPTVATEALILSCFIDAIEERDVVTCDIPGAFMQSDMKGKVVMKLEGIMAKVITKNDPKKYKRHVVKKNGKDVIYVILQKALYGTLLAALLFWKNLSAQPAEWGFEINPYDLFVANKTIDGKQCTTV